MTKKTRDPASSISLKEEIKKLEEDKKRHVNIIALYLEHRKPDLRTYGQLQTAIKRHLRPAIQLVPFFDSQIIDGFKRAADMTTEWTLETVVKVLTK